MGLIRAIHLKFEGEPFKVKFAAGFLTLLILGFITLILAAAVADIGFLGLLAVLAGLGLFALFFWSLFTIISSDL